MITTETASSLRAGRLSFGERTTMNPTAVRQAEAVLDAHVQHKPKGVSIFDDSEWSREWHRLYHLWILARWDANDAWVHAVWKSRERIVAGTT